VRDTGGIQAGPALLCAPEEDKKGLFLRGGQRPLLPFVILGNSYPPYDLRLRARKRRDLNRTTKGHRGPSRRGLQSSLRVEAAWDLCREPISLTLSRSRLSAALSGRLPTLTIRLSKSFSSDAMATIARRLSRSVNSKSLATIHTPALKDVNA